MNLKTFFMRACARLVRSSCSGVLNWFVGVFEPNKTNGTITFPYVRKRSDRNVQILIYHRINDEDDSLFPGLPCAQFANQMELLATRWRVCSLTEVLGRMSCNDVPDNAVVVTFDDGYRDNYLHAFPILQRFRIPATIFLATGVIGTTAVLWHDRVFKAFRESASDWLEGFPRAEDLFDISTISGRQVAQSAALRALWELDPSERSVEIDRLFQRLGVSADGSISRLMLSWDEIREMNASMIEFGSHTVTHPIMSRITCEQAVCELRLSKEKIESELQVSVTHFAYPVGRRQDFSDESKSLIRDAGYECAVTTIPGTNTRRQDRLELRRVTPWDEDIRMFDLRLQYLKFAT